MNHDRIAGQWKQLSGRIKQTWGKLTHNDVTRSHGNSEYLIGKIQQRYGIARQAAERQVKMFHYDL